MKRELKGNSCPCLSHVRRSAAAQIPMKRELKDIDTIDSIIGNGQWLQPKSLWRGNWKCLAMPRHASPRHALQPKSLWRGNWKSGLIQITNKKISCCSPNPYEEGTERYLSRHIPHPDMMLQPKSLWRGNWKTRQNIYFVICSTLQPKSLWRGNWKGNTSFICLFVFSAAAQIPMKRELKEL